MIGLVFVFSAQYVDKFGVRVENAPSCHNGIEPGDAGFERKLFGDIFCGSSGYHSPHQSIDRPACSFVFLQHCNCSAARQIARYFCKCLQFVKFIRRRFAGCQQCSDQGKFVHLKSPSVVRSVIDTMQGGLALSREMAV